MSDIEKSKTAANNVEGDLESLGLGVADIDDAVLRANGHKPELKRQFSWISALGLGFSITNSWAGYLVSVRSHSNLSRKLTLPGRVVLVSL